MEVRKGSVVVDTEMDYKKIDKDFKEMERHTEKLVDKFNRQCDSIKSQELAIQKVKDQMETLQMYKDTGFIKESELQRLNELTAKLPLLNSKLSQTKDEANETRRELKEAFDKRTMGGSIDGIGKKIDKFKTRMTKLIGTAMVFSLIRNQLTNLRNGFISLLKSNNQFSGSLNQIKANLMTAFAPIYNACLPAINSLMNSLTKLTGTIAMFVSGLFGKSLEDAKNEAKGLSKALDKTSASGDKASGSLASFDKLEVVNDNSSAAGVSGDSGIDYGGEIEYSQRLLDILNRIKDFVSDNQELIVGFLFGLAGGILAVKLECEGVIGLGIGLIIFGIIELVQGIMDFMKDPTWDNFGKILEGLTFILIGVAAAMIAVNAANPIGWIILAIAAVIALVAAVIKNWDSIKETLGKVKDWFYSHIIQPIGDFFVNMWNCIVDGAKNAVNRIKTVINNIITLFKNIGTKVGDAIGSAFRTVVNAVLSRAENILNSPIKTINKLLDVINKVPGIKISKLSTFNLPRLATGTVIPPRQEFAAILGDQKHGTNIETPAKLMADIFDERLAKFFNKLDSFGDNVKEIVFRNLTFVLQMGGTNFQKMVIDAIRLSEKEIGKPLLLN